MTAIQTRAEGEVAERFDYLTDRMGMRDYNFEHFRTKHLLADAVATWEHKGIRPGELAPDFELQLVDGSSVRLADLRNWPVLLHFGSFTWPITAGSVEPLKQLHAAWGRRIQFVDVVIRQAHPGPEVPPYRTFEEKMHDAERYQREERIPWPVLVDDLAGTTHQVYGGMADPTYLIGRDGRVAYYNMWTHGPSLWMAIEALLARGGSGVVNGGVNAYPYMAAAMTDGWRGLRRGLPQSFTDLMLAAPGSPILPWIGYQLRPLLAPLTLRAEPLPTAAKVGLALGGVAAALCSARWLSRRMA